MLLLSLSVVSPFQLFEITYFSSKKKEKRIDIRITKLRMVHMELALIFFFG